MSLRPPSPRAATLPLSIEEPLHLDATPPRALIQGRQLPDRKRPVASELLDRPTRHPEDPREVVKEADRRDRLVRAVIRASNLLDHRRRRLERFVAAHEATCCETNASTGTPVIEAMRSASLSPGWRSPEAKSDT